MWKVLGRKAEVVKIGIVWKEEIMTRASEYDDFETFKDLMEQGELTYLYNTQTDVHAFIIQFPESVGKDELDYFSSFIRNLREGMDVPTIAFQDVAQRCRFIFTSEEEPQLIGLNKTEGMSSGAIFQPIYDSWSKKRE